MKKSKFVRFTSLTMSVMMVALTFFATFVVPAGAADSLPYIETIKETKQMGNSAFKIAEIAPTTDTGNMGYYVKGQEPNSISGWDSRISEMYNSSERSAYVNNILSKLNNTGIISNTPDTAPLYSSGSYAEHYPWDDNAATYIGDKATNPANKLNLANTEIYSVKGNIVEMPDGTGGDYNVTYDYTLAQGENLFNYSEWRFSSSAALNGNADGDRLEFDDKNEAFTVIENGTGNSADVFTLYNYGKGYYKMQAEPKTRYKLSFNVEASTGKGQIFIFGRDLTGSNVAGTMGQGSSSNQYSGYQISTGTYTYYFTTGATCRYFTIRFGGTAKNQRVTFSKVSLTKEENIFNYDEWAEKPNHKGKDNIATASTTTDAVIRLDKPNNSIICDTGSSTAYWNLHGYDSAMTVEPNTTYSINVKVTGNGVGYFGAKGWHTDWANGTLVKDDGTVNQEVSWTATNGVISGKFTTGPHTTKVDFIFRCNTLNKSATFSDIVFKKADGNIFDFTKWADKSAGLTGLSVTEGDKLDVNRDNQTIHMAADGSKGYEFSTVANALNAYTMNVDGAETYQLSFDLAGNGPGRILVYGYNALGGATKLTASDGRTTNTTSLKLSDYYLEFRTEPGSFSDTFITSSDTTRISIAFAPGNISEDIEFSNVVIKPYSFVSEADSVQVIESFEYGAAETVYGNNLFDFNKWGTNANSIKLNNTSGTTITPDFANKSVRITNNGSNGANDVYSLYGTGVSYYFMNCEPNTRYRVSFKTTVTKGKAQFYVFPMSSGVVLDTNNTGAQLTRESNDSTAWASMGFRYLTTGTTTEYFKTSNDCIYLQIRVGMDDVNSDVTISDISIQKIENPDNYYYSVIPTEYRYGLKDPEKGTVLYTKNSDGRYEYYGVFGDDDIKIFTNVTYYSLAPNPTVMPSRYFSGTTPYRAISDRFRKAADIYDEDGLVIGKETAYFISNFASLTYIGDGSGNANLDTKGDELQTVYTNIVYYTGGFVNNEWFRYRVLEADDKNEDGTDKYTFPITVSTVTPDTEGLSTTLAYADLIVITAGTDLVNNGADAKYKKTVNTGTGTETVICDIPDESIDEIIKTVQDYIANKMPVIVDANLLIGTDCPPNLKKLVQAITTTTAGTVKGSVFIYNGTQLRVDHLVTSKFLTTIAGQQDSSNIAIDGAAYYDVAYEIYNEDVYRALRSLTPLTEKQDKVNMATVIRYIINYKKQRAYNQVSTLKVLDIEPGSTFSSLGATENDKCNTIRSMLPANMQYSNDKMTIVTMSTAEFLGKNESFEEEYDIVYIGADNTNMNTITNNCSFQYKYKSDPSSDNYDSEATGTVTNGVFDSTYKSRVASGAAKKFIVGSPIYNDTNMNGMYYTNVGDQIVTGTVGILNWNEGIEYPALSGLLKSDYVNIGSKVRDFKILGMNAGDKITDVLDDVGLDLDAKYWVKGGHATFRTSGNDINLTAMARLQSFVDSGRPVIVADQLTSQADNQTFSVSADVKMERPSSTTYKFIFTAKLDQVVPEDYVVKYNWTRIDESGNSFDIAVDQPTGQLEITSSTGQVSYTNGQYNFTLSALGTYYCWVSISHGGKNFDPVKSNTIDVKYNRQDREIFLRSTKADGHDHNFYIDVHGGLPDGFTATVTWKERTISAEGTWAEVTYGWKSESTRDIKSQYNLDKDEINAYIHFKNNGNDIDFKVKKYGGSYTNELYGRPHGKNDTDEKDAQGRKYKWRDMSTGKHTRHDVDNFNGYADNNPSGGFDVPFVFSLGTVSCSKNNDKKSVKIVSPSEINPDTLDNCSYMFQFLLKNYYRDNNTKKSGSGSALADNVFNVSDARNNTALLEDCLNNIARPRIEWKTDLNRDIEYPNKQFEHNSSGTEITLEYYIWDDSNVNEKTTYTANVYLDLNSDGKFVDRELQTGYTVSTNRISRGNNKELNIFRFKYVGKPGIVPWKLVLTENVDPNTTYQGKISYTGYSYVKPSPGEEAVEIKAIMVLPGAWSSSYQKISDLVSKKAKLTIDGQVYTVKDNYWGNNTYMGCVFNSDVFDHLDNLERMTAEEMNCTVDSNGDFIGKEDGLLHTGFKVNNGDIKIDIAVTNIHSLNKIFKEKGAESTYLKKYGMLILGFADEWGSLTSTWNDLLLKDAIIREGLELNTALAMVDFIDDGIPTLFCHDTLNTQVNFVSLFWDKAKGSAMKLGQKVFKAVDTVIGWINDLFGSDISGFTISDDEMKDTKVKDGYWNNLIMREALGLDRYGITHAITTRAKAIYNGYDDTDKNNAKYKGDEYGIYGNDILGRAYMYETIYDYKVKNVPADLKDEYDLSIERMLDTNHSVAWVPGSAQTYKKFEGDTNQAIHVEYSPNHTLKSGEQVVAKYGDVWVVGKPTTVKVQVGYDSNHDPIYENRAGYKDYRYIGVVYEKQRTVTEDPIDFTVDVNYDGVAITHDTDVYNGQPIVDKNGNIVGTYDEFTQGFTDYALQRYMDHDSDENTFQAIKYAFSDSSDARPLVETDKVTQVNRGRITTYPYDINDDDLFDLYGKSTSEYKAIMDRTQTVKPTHEQVYQCNPNGDDITVWYALSGGNAKTGIYYDPNTNQGVRNNCANGYYLFSRGNLTYTGAGHTNSFSKFEAELFINTLVAAYTQVYTVPSMEVGGINTDGISVKGPDQIDMSDKSYILVYPDYKAGEDEEYTTSEDAVLRIIDTNAFSVDTCKFYYYDKNGTRKDIDPNTLVFDRIETKSESGQIVIDWGVNGGDGKWYPAVTGNSVKDGVFKNNTMYAFDIPAEFYNLFKNDSANYKKIVLYIEPTAEVTRIDAKEGTPPEIMTGDPVTVEYRLLGLSDLS